MFNPSRLSLARRRRGLTKVRLAELTNLTVRSISGFENGDMAPSEKTLADLARELRFPVQHFHGPDIEELNPDTASFRALSSMTASRRDAVLAAGALALMLAVWIDTRFALPKPQVPDLRGHEPETAAAVLRSEWQLGELPIRNMVHLLESKGIRVFSLTEECATDVDAFSLWKADCPYVFLNTIKTAERGRFDAAHELGHLVLHRHGEPRGREPEYEADRFAAAFLMPRGSVLAVAPRFPTMEHLIALKKNWSVSVAALVHRLRSLDLLTEWQYRTLCIEIARRGYKKIEPNGIPRETSQVLSKVFAALREDGISRDEVARQLNISKAELNALVFGLVMSPVEGGLPDGEPRANTSQKPMLRLV